MKRKPKQPVEVEVMGWVQAESWQRLGLFGAAPMSDEQCLQLLAESLDSDRSLSPRDRYFASSYLRRLASNPPALKALNRRSRGRPASSRSWNIAFHYVVAKEQLCKSAAALSKVAAAWAVSQKYVAEAHAAHKSEVRYELEKLIEIRLQGSSMIREQPDGPWVKKHWTRSEILEAVDLHLLENGQKTRAVGRKK
jgi:hypothetical protein